MKMIWLDMDGTIVDLYNYPSWLFLLRAESTEPYENARPLVNFSQLARLLHRAIKKGYGIGVLSWGAANSSADFYIRTYQAKMAYLRKHLPSVEWNCINVLPYGLNKDLLRISEDDILIDDSLLVLEQWNGRKFHADYLIEVLQNLE